MGLHIFLIVLLLISLISLPKAESKNVLIINTRGSHCHEANILALGKGLLRRGHQVTVVTYARADRHSSRSLKEPCGAGTPTHRTPLANMTIFQLTVPNEDGSIPFFTKGSHGELVLPVDLFWKDKWRGFFQGFFYLLMTDEIICSSMLSQIGFPGGLLRPPYDLAVIDAFFNECAFALAHSMGLPTVAYSASPAEELQAEYLAGVWRPPTMSKGPLLHTELPYEKTYWRRVINAIGFLLSHSIMQVHFWYSHAAIQRHLPGTPHPQRLLEDVDGLLLNTDVALDYPRLSPPNAVHVGCMHCRPPQKLPPDLEEFLEGSGSAGTVLFSMGSFLGTSSAAKTFFHRFFRVFSRLPQRVIVNYAGSTDGVDVPPNVLILPWVPQEDVLGHKQIKLFISHCGMCSIMETVYHGVPVVCIPILLDQFYISTCIEDKGIGMNLKKEADENDIFKAVTEVIGKPSYRMNVLKRRQILLDTPQTALDRAVSFLEYVARHRGVPHLKLPTRHYSYVQLLGLDVLPVLMLLVFIPSFIAFKIFAAFTRILFRLLMRSYSRISGGGDVVTGISQVKKASPFSETPFNTDVEKTPIRHGDNCRFLKRKDEAAEGSLHHNGHLTKKVN